MSTDFFLPCKDCINRTRNHVHPAEETRFEPVGHRWAGGKGVGVLVTLKDPELERAEKDDTLLLENGTTLITVGELKAQRGQGA